MAHTSADKRLPATKPVFEFLDYRKYLLHYYKATKVRQRHFSFRVFAEQAGIKSPSFIKHVIDDERNLTRSVTEKLCTAMNFSPKEALYFTALVHFNQAKTALQKQEHYPKNRSST